MSPRHLVAAASAAVLSLLLAACAVPGQGTPGVAATDGDRVITVADTVVVEDALRTLHDGPHPGETLTLLLLEPEVREAARSLGFAITDAQLRNDGQLWLAMRQADTNIPLGAQELRVIRMVREMTYLVTTEGGFDELLRILQRLEDDVEASPRYGDFTVQSFANAFELILSDFATRQAELGPAIFVLFKDVNGFDAMANPGWVRDVG